MRASLVVSAVLALASPALPATAAAAEPPPTAGLRFASLALAEDFACGVALSGEAYCWGSNRDGQLGAVVKKRSPAPVAVAGGHRFRQIVVGSTRTRPGGGFACGLTVEGSVLCWGSDELGQLGDGRTKSRSEPAPLAAPAGGLVFDELRASASAVCGLERGGRVHCWGTFGQYAMASPGYGVALTVFSNPVAVGLPEGARAARLVPGPFGQPCALAESGVAYCWELQGQELAIGPVSPPGRAFREIVIASGYTNSCGVTTAGELLCWTYRQNPNQLVLAMAPSFVGTGGVLTIHELAPGVRFRQVAKAYDLWALAEDGTLHRVPGGVGDGQLDAREPERPRLAAVAGAPRLSAFVPTGPTGTGTQFALGEAGEAWGWGSNGDGQLGLGNKEVVGETPVRAGPGRAWAWLGTRPGGACGLTTEGEAYCWGYNSDGKLGDGSTKDSLVPVRVAAPVVPKR